MLTGVSRQRRTLRHMSAFIGRADELAVLDHVGGAGVAAAVVVGDPGSGKSRLLAEAAGRSASTRFGSKRSFGQAEARPTRGGSSRRVYAAPVLTRERSSRSS